ncbi:MAG: phosphoribosylformylglycinamidine synthase subunit PurQ [Syntrophomonadaceae bacterium]|nr:phosphoribosylformylglycinamidine synthase subunit PurQ [Syntrophomonadaceae bacterium]MDD3022334.1 phosphoribosylformylglycinamidine synthase subunit PurQ [Syntrophomonadaceae bacterium]
MKFGVVVFPGSNCDADCYHVIKDVMQEEVNYIWHQEANLKDYDALILPGGFSYGDYLRTGAIAKFSPVMSSVISFAEHGGLVIGICNGFQILLEAGLLPGAMLRNQSLQFICKPVYLKVKNSDSPFTKQIPEGQLLKIPIAHGEGNYFCDEKTLEELQSEKRVLFTYCGPNGEENEEYNPNGSIANIAGIINRQRNVLGMMPHPERCSESILGGKDGQIIFASMVKWLEEAGKR